MGFTFAMIVLPISTYFFTVNIVFGGTCFPPGVWIPRTDSVQGMQPMQVVLQHSWQMSS